MARLRSISMHLLIMFILSQLHTASSFRSEPAPKEDPDPTENLCRASEVQEDEFAPTPSGMDGVFQVPSFDFVGHTLQKFKQPWISYLNISTVDHPDVPSGKLT
ncbi:unnamed protein product [Cladocopium goreaui]|uniref:Uncharacterized protein n=1 Tax=Cladocopium goreaui TaxID=2562237 RepID=A0A9P1GL21_9DINO|nr:unnamed protein product [Cladocopium goreaui]